MASSNRNRRREHRVFEVGGLSGSSPDLPKQSSHSPAQPLLTSILSPSYQTTYQRERREQGSSKDLHEAGLETSSSNLQDRSSRTVAELSLSSILSSSDRQIYQPRREEQNRSNELGDSELLPSVPDRVASPDEQLVSKQLSPTRSFASSDSTGTTVKPALSVAALPPSHQRAGALELLLPGRDISATRLEQSLRSMDRNDPIIRWSPNTSRDEFMVFNVNNKVAHFYEATGQAKPGRFDFNKISKHTDLPVINTYDWSPVIRGLVAVGTAHGEVHLLRTDDNSSASISLPLKLQRSCQSVAFNATGLLAVGLDRVRNDSCLQIWDINERLSSWDSSQKGWTVPQASIEPTKKLEGSTSITSIRFFEDQPQTLVAGVKNQSVRVHDLRDPHSAVITFQTKYCNNIAIDHTDSNYFASSNLTDSGLSIWDRRTSARGSASPVYLQSFDSGDQPWGSVLDLRSAITGDKNVFIRQLRYSREHRGALGVLSTAGELRVLQTKKDFIEPGSSDEVEGSPELLHISKSYDLQYAYSEPRHKNRFENRIVSFDWINCGSSDLSGRVVALQANMDFEVLQMPDTTASQLASLIPWQPPHTSGDPYLTLLNVEKSSEREELLGPLYANAAKAEVPVFGPNRYTKVRKELVDQVKQALESKKDPVIDLLAPQKSPVGQPSANTAVTAEYLGNEFSHLHLEAIADSQSSGQAVSMNETSPQAVKSSRERHDQSHYSARSGLPMSKEEHEKYDNIMLHRAEHKYLFDCEKNKSIVADDPWLQDAWDWVSCAEAAAKNDGMVALPLDLSYLGVHSIWNNLLGEKSESRLIESVVNPDTAEWERLIATVNKQNGRTDFVGVETEKPHHRQLCLAICGLLKSSTKLDEDLHELTEAGKYTTAAAWALFESDPKRAVEILKSGGNDFVFVAMALDIKLKSGASAALDKNDWTLPSEKHPQMAKDPYLRAIYGYISTGDWTAIADEPSLPLRDRVWVALRYFDDDKLTQWLSKEMEEAILHGDIEGLVLAGITDNMVDIFAKYIEKFGDFQTPILILSFCYPRYITDYRCEAWRKAYKDFLNRHKKFILRAMFDVQSTKKSRQRDGVPVIKPPPRQVTIRCQNCDSQIATDLANSYAESGSQKVSAPAIPARTNPLAQAGINAGLCCPRCGAQLPRCASCMEMVGMPRSDKPEQSTDPAVRRMAKFPTFCLKCKHVMHLDHATEWFKLHSECPVPECHCRCNEQARRHFGPA